MSELSPECAPKRTFAAYFPDPCCNRQLRKQLKPQTGRGYFCLIEEPSRFVSAGRAVVFGIQT